MTDRNAKPEGTRVSSAPFSLNWHTVTGSNSPKFMVKGTILATALCGQNSRYKLSEIRCYDAEGHADRRYTVADAEAISDVEVKAGKRPPMVARFNDYSEALEFVSK